jgi:hypothetical protein
VSDQPVVLAVATYPYKDGAEQDFHAVWGVKHEGELDHVAAAVLEKDAPQLWSGPAPAPAGSSHFWHNIPKDDLRRMGDLLEAGQAALVVVAVDHTGEDIGALLSNATNKIVLDTTRADFETAFSQAVEEAKEAEEAKTAS